MADRFRSPSGSNDNRMRISVALLAVTFVASCSILPPSLRKPATPPESVQMVIAPDSTPAEARAKSAAPAGGEIKLYPGSGNFVAPKPPATPTLPGPEEASLNFEALDIREVAKVILGDYLKQSYTVHPAVAGTVTFRTIRAIPVKDLLPTLEMLLRQNNAAVVEEAGIYKIVPVNLVRGSVSPQLGGSPRPIPPGFSVMVVPLKYVGAREMLKLLEPFASDNTVRIDEVRNLVIIAGNQRELRHLVDTIDLFDVDWLSGYSIGLFPIKSADVKTLVQDFDRIFGAAAQSPLAGVVRVIPIERMNAILVVTTQARYLEMAKTWVERIDQTGGTAGGTRFFVYQVKNGKAENLASLIGDLFSSRRSTTTAPTLAPGSRPTEIRSAPFGQPQPTPQTTTTTSSPSSATFQLGSGTTASEVRVIADKDTNSLLILSTPSDYDVIEGALRKLDIVPRQVLVEVMLVEVSLNDDLSLGIQWFLDTRNNTTGQLNLGGLPSTQTGIPPLPAGGGLQLINFSPAGNIRAVLNTLGSDGKAQVLASPNILVLDNQKAQIKVGNRISVQTQTQTNVTTGTGVLNSFQYLETGILLAVTPRINSGGLVTLDVSQEVSVPDSNSITSGNPNPTVNSRSAQTVVVVASGDTIALGGLIREDNTRSSAGIPLLSKIPIIGAAFGTQNLHRNRTELVLMITPRIISDSTQARDATNELRDKLPALEKLLPKRQDPAKAPIIVPAASPTILIPSAESPTAMSPTISASPAVAAPVTVVVPPGSGAPVSVTVVPPPSPVTVSPSAPAPSPPVTVVVPPTAGAPAQGVPTPPQNPLLNPPK